MTKKTLIIATRESPLALWQANYAAKIIEETFEDYQTKLLPMTTKGDQILDKTLSKIGGKGLFLKELELAMLEQRADIAIHSMKDVPAHMPEEFKICGIFERANPKDAFVSNQYTNIDELPQNAIVGTSSLRRQAQLLSMRPDLIVKPLRGNVQTRLQKLDDGQFDAILLASAGLQRMDLDHRISSELEPNQWLPAVSQGAIGIECLSERKDLVELLGQLTDSDTLKCIQAERSMNAMLNGSCSSAIGGFATIEKDLVTLAGKVCSEDGKIILESKLESKDPIQLGKDVANDLLNQGAKHLLGDSDERHLDS